ncbi:MAG: DEAD/DEAH box helicase [Myxococcaceae bacterium]|nr:DEAD/DEAH box helicase [Myxococcaceae bacterium]
MSPDFSTLGLSVRSLEALRRKGYTQPTPIQAQTIPPGLSGRDVIGCAATGTGKTAAFMLPIAERLAGKRGLVGLVLAPTRELALQIAEHADDFGRPHGLKVATLIGGVGMGAQTEALKTATLVIATPGRLIDHLQEGHATLAHVEILVLDEADRMLDMGFKPQLDKILGRLPRKRQTLLFSATMAGEVAQFAKSHSTDPVRVEVSKSGTTAKNATQCVYEVGQNEKAALMLALLSEDELSTLVFTRTKRRADVLAKAIARGGYSVERIHANRSQNQRVQALEGFKSGRYRVLVATDIAARGIDVAEIGHVVNFDLPHVPADYVHRVGRTARASASGHASAFCAPEEAPLLKDIEKLIRTPVPRRSIPRESEAFQKAMSAEKAFRSQPGHAVAPRSQGGGGGGDSQRRQSRGARAGRRGGGGGGGGGARPSGKVLFSGGPKR